MAALKGGALKVLLESDFSRLTQKKIDLIFLSFGNKETLWIFHCVFRCCFFRDISRRNNLFFGSQWAWYLLLSYCMDVQKKLDKTMLIRRERSIYYSGCYFFCYYYFAIFAHYQSWLRYISMSKKIPSILC